MHLEKKIIQSFNIATFYNLMTPITPHPRHQTLYPKMSLHFVRMGLFINTLFRLKNISQLTKRSSCHMSASPGFASHAVLSRIHLVAIMNIALSPVATPHLKKATSLDAARAQITLCITWVAKHHLMCLVLLGAAQSVAMAHSIVIVVVHHLAISPGGLCPTCLAADRYSSCPRCTTKLIHLQACAADHYALLPLLSTKAGIVVATGFVTQIQRNSSGGGLITLFVLNQTITQTTVLTPEHFKPIHVTLRRNSGLEVGGLCRFLLLKAEKNQQVPIYLFHEEIISERHLSDAVGIGLSPFTPTVFAQDHTSVPSAVKNEVTELLTKIPTATTPHAPPPDIDPHRYPHLMLSIVDPNIASKRQVWLDEINKKHFLGPKQVVEQYLTMIKTYQTKSPSSTTPFVPQHVFDEITSHIDQYPSYLAQLALSSPHIFLPYNKANLTRDEAELCGVAVKQCDELIMDYTRYTMEVISGLTTLIFSMEPHASGSGEQVSQQQQQQLLQNNDLNNNNEINNMNDDSIEGGHGKKRPRGDDEENQQPQHVMQKVMIHNDLSTTILQHQTTDTHLICDKHFAAALDASLLHRKRLHCSQSLAVHLLHATTTNPVQPQTVLTNMQHSLHETLGVLAPCQDLDPTPSQNEVIAMLMAQHHVALEMKHRQIKTKDKQIDALVQALQQQQKC